MSRAEHREKLVSVFDKASEGYDLPALRFFADSASLLIGDMRLQGRESLLDAATGTGHVAIAAANALPEGRIVGIDISDGMLNRARTKAHKLGLGNISFERCDLEDTGFPDNAFDIASCAFGIFFLPDMQSGLRHILRVVKPGGRIYLTSFRSGLMEPMRGMLLARLKEVGVEPPEFASRLDTPEKLAGLLSSVGCRNVGVRSRQIGYHIKDAREWLGILTNTAFGGPLNRLPEDDRERIIEEHLKEVDGLRKKDGIRLNIEVLFAHAEKSVVCPSSS